jgi:hypothetical protein
VRHPLNYATRSVYRSRYLIQARSGVRRRARLLLKYLLLGLLFFSVIVGVLALVLYIWSLFRGQEPAYNTLQGPP